MIAVIFMLVLLAVVLTYTALEVAILLGAGIFRFIFRRLHERNISSSEQEK